VGGTALWVHWGSTGAVRGHWGSIGGSIKGAHRDAPKAGQRDDRGHWEMDIFSRKREGFNFYLLFFPD